MFFGLIGDEKKGLVIVILASDSFNRANSTTSIGTADTGQAWSNIIGIAGINGNKAYIVETADAVAAMDALNGNVDIRAVLSSSTAWPATAFSGLAFRVVDANNFLLFTARNDFIRIYKKVGGPFTQVTSASFAPSAGVNYNFKVVIQDAVINGYVDDVLKGSHTLTGSDATLFAPSVTKCGIHGSPSPSNVRYDNFEVRA